MTPGEGALARGALVELLSLGGLDPALAQRIIFEGRGDIYPTPLRLGAAMGAMIAAAKLAEDAYKARAQSYRLDLGIAAATSSSFRYVLLDGASVKGPRDPLTGFYRCRDGGFLFLHLNFPHHRARAFAALGLSAPDKAAIEAAVAGRRGPELESALVAAGAPAALARSRGDWRASGAWAALDGQPLVRIAPLSGPGLGPGRAGTDAPKVVDFTRVLAGPTCGRVLAEAGAEVLRINNPHVDDLRAYELDANRDKAQETLDLRTENGRAALHARLATADVFLQAYRPGVAEGLGFGAATLARSHPGLVHVSLSAYGAAIPRRGFDSVLQPDAGIAVAQARWSGNPLPELLPTSPIDYLSGYLLAFGTFIALARRAAGGGGHRVETSLAQVADWLGAFPENPAPPREGPSEAQIAAWRVDSPSPAGRVSHLRSPIIPV